MLLLLESKCIFGDEEYEASLKSIIASYYRDFPKHEETFQPWFLMNDIMRYWKTLLLNYENRRNRGDTESEVLWSRVKNFKLRFSRMTTCFATIAALGSFPGTPTEADVYSLTLLTPQERLRRATEQMPDLTPSVDTVLSSYSWFLQQTSLSTSDLEAKFVDRDSRIEMFQRAEEYGGRMFELISEISAARKTAPDLMRYLVI